MLLLHGHYRLCGSGAHQNDRNASGEDRDYCSDHGTTRLSRYMVHSNRKTILAGFHSAHNRALIQ